MTTKAGQAPPIGSSHLGISGGTCHSSGSASCSEGLHSWRDEALLGAGLGLGWEGGRGSLPSSLPTQSAAWLFPHSSGERQGTGITFCSGCAFFTS